MSAFPGYTITETLSHTKDLTLARGLRADDGAHVIIKISPSSSRSHLRQLENEFHMAGRLGPGFALRPLRLERTAEQAALVFEDFAGISLDHYLGAPMELGPFLATASKVAAKVAEMHERGIIHRDLKPQNILYNVDTGEARIIDFGISSVLPVESRSSEGSSSIEATLAYMSPEQTGRMNRAIDHRTDIYSLGVTFFHMLVGRLPFVAEEPLEWFHCHVARPPPSPHLLRPEIPRIVSDIILKMLAKDPEQRYFSGYGLECDLNECLAQWKAAGRIEPFILGARDVYSRFVLPQKLYGREHQVAVLLQAYDRMLERQTAGLMLVSGQPGIGKSALVHEAQRLLVRERGFFISGKFDLQSRDVPYATVARAFGQLVDQIFWERGNELGRWKQRIQAALGPNARLVTEIVPALSRLIGDGAKAVEVDVAEARNHLHRTFLSFVQAVARRDAPLVVFLDDMQWADSASLDLMQYLVSQPENGCFLFIVAYRGNEVTPSHPLRIALSELERVRANVSRIELGPLTPDCLIRLIADTLHGSPEEAKPLAELVHEKTAGNPFFLRQFLMTLYTEGHIRFDWERGRWLYDLAAVRAAGYTDNVVELILTKLKRLSPAAQRAISLAACLGHSGGVPTLSVLLGGPEEVALRSLRECIDQGLVLSLPEGYKFAHDRIQQAAYSLIPQNERAPTHLAIARKFLAGSVTESLDERLFDLVNHLNLGASFVSERKERESMARLNLAAARKAKAAAAYDSALSYCSHGIQALDKEAWETLYDVAFGLHLVQAECEFLKGFVPTEKLDFLLRHARTRLDKAAVYGLKISAYTTAGEAREAIRSALECLTLFEIRVSEHPSWDEVSAELARVEEKLGDRTIESLVDLPVMESEEMKAAMRILSKLYGPAFYSDTNLFAWHLCHMVDISLTYGNTPASTYAYGCFGMALGAIFHRYEEGYRFAKVGYELMAKHDFKNYRAQANFFMEMASLWSRPIDSAFEFIRTAFRVAVDTGDVPIACFCCNHDLIDRLTRGDTLKELYEDSLRHLDFIGRAGFKDQYDTVVSIQRVIQAMRGKTLDLTSFSDADFDEQDFECGLEGRQPTMICFHYIMKLMARFLAGDYQGALLAGKRAKEQIWASLGHIQYSYFYFFFALTVAALYNDASPQEKRESLKLLYEHESRLQQWRENCPSTFAAKHSLIAAEIARVRGEDSQAMGLYEEAVRLARDHGFIHDQGLAYELGGMFYLAQGFEDFGLLYLRKARECYLHWGALGKARSLECRYPRIAGPRPLSSLDTVEVNLDQLELLPALHASQAVSREIELGRLVQTLMRAVLMHSGAERACLLLARDGELWTEAEASVGERGTSFSRLQERPLREAAELPRSLIEFVSRSETPVIWDRSLARRLYFSDDYIASRMPQSVACLPILSQTALIGVLYVENRSAANVFDELRSAILDLLASQAAISITNARLYQERRQAEEELKDLYENAPCGYHSINLDGFFVRMNATELKWLGYSREEVIGKMRITDVLSPESRQLHRANLLGFRETGRVREVEYEMARRDGSSFPALLSATAIRDAQGKVIMSRSTVFDITERKSAARALIRKNEELLRTNAELEQFTYVASHDLKEPLRMVSSYVKLLARKYEPVLDESGREFVHFAVSGAERMKQLIDSLLAYTRAGSSSYLPTPVQAQQALDLALVNLHEAIEESRAEVTHGELPTVIGHSEGIVQLFQNLIANAIKFRGEDRLRVHVDAARTEDAKWRFTVKDNGIGIEKKYHQQIFRVFERLHERDRYEGTGIGLAICKKIVEEHHGIIGVESEPGFGSTFYFTLPAVNEDDSADEQHGQ